MHRFVSACVTGAAALALLQACERLTTESFPATIRTTQSRAAPPNPAVKAEAASAQPAARPLTGPTALTDAMITAHIKARLLTDRSLDGADISVNTERGVVNLAGTVRSHEQLAVASAHAQGEEGVMRIESHVAVLTP